MRPVLVTLAVLTLGGAGVRAASAQVYLDARQAGLAGLRLHHSGLAHYNVAYRAVPERQDHWSGGFTIPIPLGILQVIHDSAAFDTDSSYFNPLETANLLLHPPLYYEIKKAPTPTNDVTFTIGRDSFAVDLGAAKNVIPTDEFGLGGSSRLMDPGFAIKGVRLSAMVWLHDEVGFQLGQNILNFLRDAQPAQTNTRYSGTGDAIVEGGVAPSLGWSGRILNTGDDNGLYVGAAAHYYLGVGFGQAHVDGGFTTGDTLFGGANPVSPDYSARSYYSKPGHSLGTGVGADVGAVWVSGPLEIGVGLNDIGAKLKWNETRVDSAWFDPVTDSSYSRNLANNVSYTTKLPTTYLMNAALELGTGTTLGGDLTHSARGTEIHVGAEQRFGPLAVRGGVRRDLRKQLQFGWGGGVRFWVLSLDVGFFTHSSSISNARGVTMATSLTIY